MKVMPCMRRVAVALALCGASVALAQVVLVPTAPPAMRAEPVPPPRAGFVWDPGHWRWEGGRYAWVGGHWIGERVGHRWIPGHWAQTGRGWRWIEGHWI